MNISSLWPALCLSLTLAFVTACGKSNADRLLPPDKLRAFLPTSIAGLTRKEAAKKEEVTDEFSAATVDFTNEHGETFHFTILDQFDEGLHDRFVSKFDKKWTKFTHRGSPGRERMAEATPGSKDDTFPGKLTFEVLVGKRFVVRIVGDEGKNRSLPAKAVRAALEAVDVGALAGGTPPSAAPGSSPPSSSGSASASASTAPSEDPGLAVTPTPVPTPSYSGTPNWLSRRIETALMRVEDQRREQETEIAKLERSLKLSGKGGNQTVERSLADRRAKLAEIKKREDETRRDLINALKNPPPSPTAPKPTPTPEPTKPSLRETWTKQVEPMLKAPGQGAAVIDIIGKLPIEEKQTVEYHSALARASRDTLAEENAAQALLTLSVLAPTPPPEVAPVQAWVKKRAEQGFKLAVAAAGIGDAKTAIKAYLAAVRLDSSLLAREVKGDLRDRALKSLSMLVEKQPDRNDYLHLLGIYSYFVGESSIALSSFKTHFEKEKDPYLKWRAQAWLKKVQAETTVK